MFPKSPRIPCFKKLLSAGSVVIFTETAAITLSMLCIGIKSPLHIVHMFSYVTRAIE
jgi:hypothetical protein